MLRKGLKLCSGKKIQIILKSIKLISKQVQFFLAYAHLIGYHVFPQKMSANLVQPFDQL